MGQGSKQKEKLKCEEESTEEKRLRSDLFVLYSFLRRGSREGDVELFYLASSDVCRCFKDVPGRLKLDIRKHYFT